MSVGGWTILTVYGQTIFRPKGMTPEQLAEGCFKMRQDFGAYSSTVGTPAPQANAHSVFTLFAYLAVNVASIKEIYNKQGEMLWRWHFHFPTPLPAAT